VKTKTFFKNLLLHFSYWHGKMLPGTREIKEFKVGHHCLVFLSHFNCVFWCHTFPPLYFGLCADMWAGKKIYPSCTVLPITPCRSYRGFPAFAGSNPDYLFNGMDKYLSITDLAGLCCLFYRTNDLWYKSICCNYLQFYLWDKVNNVLGTSIELGMAFLPSEPFYFCNGQTLNTYLIQGILHLIKFKG